MGEIQPAMRTQSRKKICATKCQHSRVPVSGSAPYHQDTKHLRNEPAVTRHTRPILEKLALSALHVVDDIVGVGIDALYLLPARWPISIGWWYGEHGSRQTLA